MGRSRLRPLSKNKAIYKSFLGDFFNDINNIEGEALRESAKHIRGKMRKKAKIKFKKKTGNLLKGIRFEIIKSITGKTAFVGVGRPAYHAHLLELGTIDRETKKGYSKGKITKTPFIIPTFDEESEAVKKIMMGSFQKL